MNEDINLLQKDNNLIEINCPICSKSIIKIPRTSPHDPESVEKILQLHLNLHTSVEIVRLLQSLRGSIERQKLIIDKYKECFKQFKYLMELP